MLTVLAIAGTVFVMLGTGFRFGLTARATQARESGGQEDLVVFHQTLQRLLADLDPGQAQADPPVFEGAPHAMRFQSGERVYRLRLVAGQRLILEYTEPFATVTGDPTTGVSPLLEGVERLNLSYWQPGTGWLATWSEPRLPRLIRLHVAFPAGVNRHMPDVIAAPMREAPRS